MKKSFVKKAALFLICSAIFIQTGCGGGSESKEAGSQETRKAGGSETKEAGSQEAQKAAGSESVEADSSETEEAGGGFVSFDDQIETDGKESLLFETANLAGNVRDIGENGFSIIPAQNVWEGEASDAALKEEELIQIAFGDTVKTELLTMDLKTNTAISMSPVQKSDIQKESSVLIFGTQQDTGNWTADQVIIVKWQ